MTPTQRSLAHFRAQGRYPVIVERWNPYAKIRQDMYGCLDLVVIGGGVTIGCQTTSGSNVSARIEKMKASPYFSELKRSGWLLCVHGWRKAGPRGKRKTWALREEWL